MNIYKLIQGDCLQVLPTLEDESIDLVLTDPPYGISYQSGGRTEQFNKLVYDDNLTWFSSFIEEVSRVLKNNTHFYCFTRWDVFPTQLDIIKKHFDVKNLLVIKTRGGMGDLNHTFIPNFESVVFCQKGKRGFESGIIRVSKTTLNDPRYSGDGFLDRYPALIDFIQPNVFNLKLIHPTQKTTEIMRFFINISSIKNDLVLDPFIGSGTTMEASQETGRSCIGMEIDPDFAKMTHQRCFGRHFLDREVKYEFSQFTNNSGE